MAVVDTDEIWRIVADLVEMGRREDAERLKNLKDEYIKLRAVFLFNSTRTLPDGIREDDERLRLASEEASRSDRETFIQWDMNLRADKAYGVERGSATEWHWANFVANGGPVTMAMVEHASTADPEGWKRAINELEEEGK